MQSKPFWFCIKMKVTLKDGWVAPASVTQTTQLVSIGTVSKMAPTVISVGKTAVRNHDWWHTFDECNVHASVWDAGKSKIYNTLYNFLFINTHDIKTCVYIKDFFFHRDIVSFPRLHFISLVWIWAFVWKWRHLFGNQDDSKNCLEESGCWQPVSYLKCCCYVSYTLSSVFRLHLLQLVKVVLLKPVGLSIIDTCS